MAAVKDCFGRTITDSDKLEECRICELRDECLAVQWSEDFSGTRVVEPRPAPHRSSGR